MCDPIQCRKGYLHKQSGERDGLTTVQGVSTTAVMAQLVRAWDS